MTCSPYAVTSALVVACPTCKAMAGQRCFTSGALHSGRHDQRKFKACATRRRLADEQRTREVNPEVMKP